MTSLHALAVLSLIPLLPACDTRSCDVDPQCVALEEALSTRGSECEVTSLSFCPYDGNELASGLVCAQLYDCVDRLLDGSVPCDALDGLSIAECTTY